jgi:comEA protein
MIPHIVKKKEVTMKRTKKETLRKLATTLAFLGLFLPSSAFWLHAATRPASVAPVQVVSVNTASAEELELVPGIGPAIAARIVSFRNENGPFKAIDELTVVKGIGEKKLERMKNHLTL